jgi:hypothetical protein
MSIKLYLFGYSLETTIGSDVLRFLFIFLRIDWQKLSEEWSVIPYHGLG